YILEQPLCPAVSGSDVSSLPPEELEVLARAVARLTADPKLLQREDLAFVRAWASRLAMQPEPAAASVASSSSSSGSPRVSLAQRAAAAAAAAKPWLQGPEWKAAWSSPSQPSDIPTLPGPSAPRPGGSVSPPPAASAPGVPIYYPPELRGPATGSELPDGLKVFIATPAYGGQVTVDYMTSVIHLVTQLKE
ncbi:unnamed protein product, partial [Polarella glacialis]